MHSIVIIKYYIMYFIVAKRLDCKCSQHKIKKNKCEIIELSANTTLQYTNISNQHFVCLKFIQCYMSIISQNVAARVWRPQVLRHQLLVLFPGGSIHLMRMNMFDCYFGGPTLFFFWTTQLDRELELDPSTSKHQLLFRASFFTTSHITEVHASWEIFSKKKTLELTFEYISAKGPEWESRDYLERLKQRVSECRTW